jgi:hypothetical protein
MLPQDRINQARSNSFEAHDRLKHLRCEQLELCEKIRRQAVELRVAQMKHWILMAEIKKNSLLGDELYGVSRRTSGCAESKPFGWRIQ